jgi:hypothetical protein
MENVIDNIPLEDLLQELRVRKTPGLKERMLSAGEYDALGSIKTDEIVENVTNRQKVIYGVDDRQDLFQVTDQSILDSGDSVVSLWNVASVVDNGNGASTLITQNYGASQNLCSGEPFRNQPVGAFCSGFLVAPDIIATAGHCVDTGNVATTRFVFGYRMTDATNAQIVVDNGEIYRGTSLIGRRLTTGGTDWALVRLDRQVANHRIATIRRAGMIPNNQAVYVIGHPSGLPIKYAPGANVRDNSPAEFFVANLDTYGGNSGSPVFNVNTHEVEGILVRGENDFVQSGTCMVSLVCPNTGCRGEDVTRTVEFASLVPEGQVLAAEGKLNFLRVHDVGTGWGPPNDFLDVEVVIKLDSQQDRAFGFQLRDDSNAHAHSRMVDLLRDAFNRDSRVRIDYIDRPGRSNGRILRVIDVV